MSGLPALIGECVRDVCYTPPSRNVQRRASMEAFQSRGKIIAGVSFDIPGMGYKNPQTGRIEGFEADLARAIAEKMLGAPDRIDFLRVSNEQRFPSLQDDLVDMVLDQITITPDRAERVDFSVPYYVTREAILVPQDSRITSFEDLKHKRIAVTAGSISIRRMRAALPDATLVVVPLNHECLQAVAKGEADAASNDLINLKLMVKATDHPDQYTIIDTGDRFDQKPYGVAVKKGNSSLIDFLNETIESLKANGDIDELLDENLAHLSDEARR
jgi:ABC-type amino acid transport substrate-binding protein